MDSNDTTGGCCGCLVFIFMVWVAIKILQFIGAV